MQKRRGIRSRPRDKSTMGWQTAIPFFMYPHYSYPLPTLLQAACDWLLLKRRSFRSDAQACLRRLSPPLAVLGCEHIPRGGPCLLVFNHYHRPGFGAWWLALALAATVPAEIHFIMTNELTFPGRWYGWAGRPLSRLLLGRAARMYGFTSMPPMPPRPRDVAGRAAAVREALAFATANPQAVIGLSPEGGDAPGGALAWPPPGAGRFISLLAARGFPLVPVGCYEEAGAFCLRFGAASRLEVRGGTAAARDREAARQVMTRIARQLPERLRGPFTQT